MDSVDISIIFDSPSNAFYPGTCVSGQIIVRNDKPLKIKGLRFEVEGKAHICWDERRTDTKFNFRDPENVNQVRVYFVPFSGEEEYFKNSYILLGETEMPAGEVSYNFSTSLPPTLPSTFRGEYGGVKYIVRAIVERQWKYNQESIAEFFIVNPIDLNYDPVAAEPIKSTFTKSFCWWWCQSGPLTLSIAIPQKGFVPGQSILITLDAENASNIDIDILVCRLVKHIKWTCKRPNENIRNTYDELGKVVLEGIAARCAKIWQDQITVPPDLPPVSLESCLSIKQNFYVEIEAKSIGCHTNLLIEVPIIIGSVPIQISTPATSYPQMMMATSPMIRPSVQPSVATVGNNSLSSQQMLSPGATMRSPSPGPMSLAPSLPSGRAPSPSRLLTPVAAPAMRSPSPARSLLQSGASPSPVPSAIVPMSPIISISPAQSAFSKVTPAPVAPPVIKPPINPSSPFLPAQTQIRRSPSPAPTNQPGVYHSFGGYPELAKKPVSSNPVQSMFDPNLLSSAYPNAPYPTPSSEPVRASSEGPSPAPPTQTSRLPFKIPSFSNLKF